MSDFDILPIGWVEDYFLDALQRWASRIPDHYRDALFSNILPAPLPAPLAQDVTIAMKVHRDHPISDDPISGRVFVYEGKNNQNKTQRLLHMRIALGAPIDATEKQHLMASDDYSYTAFLKALQDLFSGDAALTYDMLCGNAEYHLEINRRKVLARVRDAEGNELPPIERDFKNMGNWLEFCAALRDTNLARVKFVSRSRSFLHHVALSTIDHFLLVLDHFIARSKTIEDRLGTVGKASMSEQDLSRRSRELRDQVQRSKDQLLKDDSSLSQAKLMLSSAKTALARLQRLESNPDLRGYVSSLSHLKRYEVESQRLEGLRDALRRDEAVLAKQKERLTVDEARLTEVEEAMGRLYTALDRRGDRIRKLKPVLASIQGASADRNVDLILDYERTLGVYSFETQEVLRKLHDLPVWNELTPKMQVPTDGDIDSPRSITYLRDEVRDLYYMVAESRDLQKEVEDCVSAFHQAKITSSQQYRELNSNLGQLRKEIEALDVETTSKQAEIGALSQAGMSPDGAAEIRQQIEDVRHRLSQDLADEWTEVSEVVRVLVPKDTPEEFYSQALIKRVSELTSSVTQAERQVQSTTEQLKTLEDEQTDVANAMQRSGSPEGSAWQEVNTFRLRLVALRELLEHYRNSIVVNPALVRAVMDSHNEVAATSVRGVVSKKQAKMAELTPQEKYLKARNDLSYFGREAMEVLKKALMRQIPFAFGVDGREHPIVDLDVDELAARFDGLEVSGGATSALALWAWSNEPTEHIFRTIFLVDEIGDLNSLVRPLFGRLMTAPGFGFSAMARNVDGPFRREPLLITGGVVK